MKQIVTNSVVILSPYYFKCSRVNFFSPLLQIFHPRESAISLFKMRLLRKKSVLIEKTFFRNFVQNSAIPESRYYVFSHKWAGNTDIQPANFFTFIWLSFTHFT